MNNPRNPRNQRRRRLRSKPNTSTPSKKQKIYHNTMDSNEWQIISHRYPKIAKLSHISYLIYLYFPLNVNDANMNVLPSNYVDT